MISRICHVKIFVVLLIGSLEICCAGKFQRLLNSGEEECDIDCTAEAEVAICGTDGRSYRSSCEIEKANCEGHPVSVKNVGKCPDAPRCFTERKHAQELARRPAAGIFIPECHEDGSYQESQCHTGSGYCWCVDKQGKPIPGSSARFFRPNCQAYQNAQGHKRTSRGRKARNGCTINDRKEFNRNMIQIFGSEYNRSRNSHTDSTNTSLGLRIVNWKFGQLDVDSNQQLNKLELRDLRKMVRKIVHPKPCSRTFTQSCDLDQDKVITRPEWEVCLDAAQSNLPVFVREVEETTATPQTNTAIPIGAVLDVSNGELPRIPVPPSPVRRPVGLPRGRNPLSWRADSSESKEDFTFGGIGLQEVVPVNLTAKRREPPKKSMTFLSHVRKPDCRAEHARAAAKQRRDPSAGTYVPHCDKTGNYELVQCHEATGFCWCVNPASGKPVPQTSTHNSQPNCKNVGFRSLKGCPASQKDAFLGNLTTLLSAQMMESFTANNRSTTIQFRPSSDDAIKWKFRSLDKNTNAAIERSEWKDFKQFIVGSESLRKCGRRLFKFCDADDNRKVTVEEWLQCTSVRPEPPRIRPKPRGRGPNPLERFLKAD